MEPFLLLPLLISAWWETVLGLDFMQDLQNPAFVPLGQNQTVDCDCAGLHCEQVVWFRTLLPSGLFQVLARSNQADRVSYEPGLKQKVRISKKSGGGYSLRILSADTADRGVYSCVLKIRGNKELWRSGLLVLPGESPVTEGPLTTPGAPSPSLCPCEALTPPPAQTPPTGGCGSLVLWPMVGMISALSLGLICTLYYYSRLPRKCRHQFRKK